ncbi:hypothetical protein GCM10011504_35650 [Siccirubricoccus deserti]|uniref:Uncharacterized protein n=1 Tax=Siccirubricoccus deserti TaxID=2013562 RepID=A0A9X0R0J8_9PROT|nr:hypothetical protein [Siccirubricoccus deserti]MBC4017254.1 hypothetical protein [Siccirubricoccus deserti]GGC54159.1 hypothetical protein GCM10011504_35650 [Siccirubricoccus deserti]
MISGILSHIHAHRWLWIAVFSLIAFVAWLIPVEKNTVSHFGDVTAISLMVVGILLILQSQEGYISPTVAAAMAEEEGLAENPA